MVKRFGFGRKEKLKSRKVIENLFENGRSFSIFPIRVSYLFIPSDKDQLLQVGVSAGKKYFKRAVDRNRIKRLIREAYRLQKEELFSAMKQHQVSGFAFFIYTGKTIAPFQEIKDAMQQCLKRLQQKIKD